MKKILLLLVVFIAALAAALLLKPENGLATYEKPWHFLATRRMDTGCASYVRLKGNVDHFTETGLVDGMPELSYIYYDEKGRVAGKILAIQEDMIFGQFDHIALDYHEDRVEMWRLFPAQLLRTFSPGPDHYFGTVYDVRLDRHKHVELKNNVMKSYIAGELHTQQTMTPSLAIIHGRYFFQDLERWFEVDLDRHDNPTYIRLGRRNRSKSLQQRMKDGFRDTDTVETKIEPYSRFAYEYDERGNWVKCTLTLLNADGTDLDSSDYTRTITYRD